MNMSKIVNFAARVVSGRRKYDNVADVRDALLSLSAADLSSFDTLMLLHKVVCNGEPVVLTRMFHRNEEIRERSTRQDNQLLTQCSLRSREASLRLPCGRAIQQTAGRTPDHNCRFQVFSQTPLLAAMKRIFVAVVCSVIVRKVLGMCFLHEF